MDPFEVRMQFLTLLNRLTSSLASIQRVSSFALKHSRHSDDIWDCLVEECGTMNLNARINLLYFLDTLLDKAESLPIPGGGGSTGAGGGATSYKELIKRDLSRVVELVVPESREGVLNLMSANQVLKSWRTRRILDVDLLDSILLSLESRQSQSSTVPSTSTSSSKSLTSFSRNDILRRIEDDRERHKRLRERIWVLPVPNTLVSSYSLPGNQGMLGSSFNGESTKVAVGGGGGGGKSSPATTNESVSPASPSDIPLRQLQLQKKFPPPPPPVPLPPPSPVSTLPSPAPPTPSSATTTSLKPPTSSSTSSNSNKKGPEIPIEIEFEQLWERTREEIEETRRLGGEEVEEGKHEEEGGVWVLTAEERGLLRKERERCFPGEGDRMVE